MIDLDNLPYIETLQDLADFLRTVPSKHNDAARYGFDMGFPELTEKYPCNSACCIGGWLHLCRPDLPFYTNSLENLLIALKPGLPVSAAVETCYPKDMFGSGAWRATPQEAADAIEYLDRYNECGWTEIMNRRGST